MAKVHSPSGKIRVENKVSLTKTSTRVGAGPSICILARVKLRALLNPQLRLAKVTEPSKEELSFGPSKVKDPKWPYFISLKAVSLLPNTVFRIKPSELLKANDDGATKGFSAVYPKPVPPYSRW